MKNINVVKNDNIPLMLGIRETAKRYALSQNYVRTLLLSGKVKGVRIGRGKLLCNCNDLERFLSESYVNQPEQVQSAEIKPIPVKI